MMKKRLVFLVMLAALLLPLLLTACTTDAPEGETTGGGETVTDPPATELSYSVKVADYFGNGMEDVIVKIVKDGESVVMKATKADGVARFQLEKGSYDVSLDFPDEALKSAYAYDATALQITPEVPELTVTLYQKYSETVGVQGYSYVRSATVPTQASLVSEGAYILSELNTADRTYFLFRPTRTGIYRFSVISDARFEFGYYGGILNGSRESLLPVENKTITIEVRNSNVGSSNETTTPYLLGVMPKSESVRDCILVIERVGDVPFSPADVPWRTVLPTKNDLKQINYLNWSFSGFTSVDLTSDEVNVIYNQADGFYHYETEDGPIVYLRLNTASGYLGENGTIYEMAEMSHIGVMFYDDDGKFLYKEEYNQLIFDYAAISDPVNGACPLTKQLVYVIETVANARGWFDPASANYLFANASVNSDMMPYFACGYYQTVTENTSGSENDPVRLTAETKGSLLLEKGTPLFLKTAAAGLTFEILDADGDLKVVCNGKTYVANKDGKIQFTVSDANTVFTLEVLSDSTATTVSTLITEIT